MSSKILWGIETSNIDLSYKKLRERRIQLWTMYDLNLLKLSNFLIESLWAKNMLSYQFVDLFDQIWILL
jgi:hypothetical protein